MPLTMKNWRSFWVVAIGLAQKMWDDNPLKTSFFTRILPSFSRNQFRQMESEALSLLDFNTGVKPSLYASYYFLLRQLFADIIGFDTSLFTLKPLSIVGAQKMVAKSLQDEVSRAKRTRKSMKKLEAAADTSVSHGSSSAGTSSSLTVHALPSETQMPRTPPHVAVPSSLFTFPGAGSARKTDTPDSLKMSQDFNSMALNSDPGSGPATSSQLSILPQIGVAPMSEPAPNELTGITAVVSLPSIGATSIVKMGQGKHKAASGVRGGGNERATMASFPGSLVKDNSRFVVRG